MKPRYSVVVPLHNEAGNILPLIDTAVAVLEPLAGGHEILLVNDGSTDTTDAEIAAAALRWPQCVAIRLPHRLGQAHALLTGLQAARGDFILTMDGDGQNDPRDFPALLAPVEAGALDVACGWRLDRQDSALRCAMSCVANTIRRRVLGDSLLDAGCQLRVLHPRVVPALFPCELLQTFLPVIALAAGFRVGEFPVRHHPRGCGRPNYGLLQLWWRPALAMLRLRARLRR